MSLFSITDDEGSTGHDSLPDESFRTALVARFGEDKVAENEAAVAPPVELEDSAPADTPGGDDGSSPLLPSPPTIDEDSATDGFVVVEDDDPANLAVPTGEATTSKAAPIVDTPPADDLDLNDLLTRWNGGVKPDRTSITNLLSFVQQVSALSPDQQRALDSILSGNPVGDSTATTVPAPPAPTPSSSAPASSLLPDDLAPESRAILAPIVARLEAQEAQFATQQAAAHQATLEAQQATIQSGISSASQAFVDEYRSVLTTNDLILLETKVMQGGQFPFFLSQHNGDAAAAYKSLLEATVYADSDLRTRITAAQSAPIAAQEAADTVRKRKASAVSAGGNTANTPPAPIAPLTKSQRTKAAIDDVARLTGMSSVSRRQ